MPKQFWVVTIGIVILSIPVSLIAGDDYAFSLRLVRPDSFKLASEPEYAQKVDLTDYDKIALTNAATIEVLWVSKKAEITGKDLQEVRLGFSKGIMTKEQMKQLEKEHPERQFSAAWEKKVLEGGDPRIILIFSQEGAQKLARVTEKHLDRQLAFVLDGRVIMAPIINQPLTAGEAMIVGESHERAEQIVKRLKELIKTNKRSE